MRYPAQRVAPALAGQVAIVTGASSGIGAATARELARRGATVVLAARRVGELTERAAEIGAAGGVALVVPTDLALGAQVSGLAERASAELGRVDVLVNNAGAKWSAQLAESAPDGIASVIAVNLLGAMLLTRAVLPGMLERGHGATRSRGSNRSFPGLWTACTNGVIGPASDKRKRHGCPDHRR